MRYPNNKEQGITYIEVMVSVVIVGFILLNLMQLTNLTLRSVTKSKKDEVANLVARECFEAVRNFRDNTQWSVNGIGTLAVNTSYHPAITVNGATSSWAMATGTETTSAVTRSIVFSNVSRDPTSKNIESVYNAANLDTQTRLATITVSYGTNSYAYKAYFTNWH